METTPSLVLTVTKDNADSVLTMTSYRGLPYIDHDPSRSQLPHNITLIPSHPYSGNLKPGFCAHLHVVGDCPTSTSARLPVKPLFPENPRKDILIVGSERGFQVKETQTQQGNSDKEHRGFTTSIDLRLTDQRILL
ncbi:hypothetical protein CAPTEDRAFT_188475 [Capitella teleta]|uniref:Uncharacterized protein n=1 Tax=Capitella teleta TaxID=283909 RepID=R7V3Z3_CAPTE|nr:hypothetical protein CAPTEDRAFT_188475 [Capitella teleta]|eukprot:ELU11076.1 hypothetical protein CAPTEDRAFT_188475 [Capitella teleta]